MILKALQAGAALVVLGRLRHGRVRREPLLAGPAGPGSVSVVVPARDEAQRIGACLTGPLSDPDVDEVLVVDDGSQDATARIAADAGAQVVAAGAPPEGWAGKAWALQRGLQEATSEHVLFLDADVRSRPGLAGALLAAATENGDDVLSAALAARCATPADRVLHPAFTATLAYRFGAPDARDVRPRILNGQCLLVPRRKLLDAGGMEPVHDALVEDVALARTLAAAGWSLGWVDATALAEVAGYADARATWDGWGRSIALPGVEPAAKLWGELALLLLVTALPVLRLLAGRTRTLDRALLAIRWSLAVAVGKGYRPRSGLVLLAPFADPLVVARMAESLLRPSATWRGRRFARGRALR